MNAGKKPAVRKPTLREIDDLVISQAGNDAAWEAPVEVRRNKPGSFSIPPDLTERAAFLARTHRAPGVEEWLAKVIKERIADRDTVNNKALVISHYHPGYCG